MGELVPTEITVFKDRTYTFVMKEPPASELIKQAAKIKKGSGKALLEKAGSLTKAQLKEIAEAPHLLRGDYLQEAINYLDQFFKEI